MFPCPAERGKGVKAFLTAHGATFPRTHNLEELGLLVTESGIGLPAHARDLRRLTPFAVDCDYQGTHERVLRIHESSPVRKGDGVGAGRRQGRTPAQAKMPMNRRAGVASTSGTRRAIGGLGHGGALNARFAPARSAATAPRRRARVADPAPRPPPPDQRPPGCRARSPGSRRSGRRAP